MLSVSGSQSFPGGAANVARNVSALGGACTLVGVVGADAAGRELKDAVEAIERLSCELCVASKRSTSEKTRFISHGQHMLRMDSEMVAAIDSDVQAQVLSCIARLAPAHDVMVLSDYAKGLLTDEVVSGAIAIAAALRLPVAVDPKSVDLARYAGATVITPNSKEVFEATGIDPTEDDASAELAGDSILRSCGARNVLVTRAHRGMTLMGADSSTTHFRASARGVFDVVGAGDTAIATLALALGARLDLSEGARLANAAAGIVVGKRGTATVTQTKLDDELLRLEGGALMALQSKIMSLDEIVELAQTWRKTA